MNPPLDPSLLGGLVRFVLDPSSLYPASRTKPGHPVVQHPGRLPERPMGADCKSVGVCLQWFESTTCHRSSRVVTIPAGHPADLARGADDGLRVSVIATSVSGGRVDRHGPAG